MVEMLLVGVIVAAFVVAYGGKSKSDAVDTKLDSTGLHSAAIRRHANDTNDTIDDWDDGGD